jgi:hypothetical protein
MIFGCLPHLSEAAIPAAWLAEMERAEEIRRFLGELP